MLEKELSFADLSISLSELYEAMGYADAVPDEAVEKEVRGVLGRVVSTPSMFTVCCSMSTVATGLKATRK